MSIYVNGERMIHAAVNTDPLEIQVVDEQQQAIHYGLKERKIPHLKIKETKDIKAWYDVGAKIGEGAFGVVLDVLEKATNQHWAMKTVSKTNSDHINLIRREIHVLKLIEHPHIIYLDKVFESPRNIYMIFEKCHSDFSKIYNKKKPFDENITKKIISELVDAVAYLHKYDIVHRDLKMENILLGENPDDTSDEYYIKLTDFGLSIVKYGKGLETMLHDYCGTLHYMAPEIITNQSYSQMCDMWSVGVILYMLLIGDYPFMAHNEPDLQDMICNEEPKFEQTQLTKEAKNLIVSLLVKNPAHRLRATEVLKHPWIRNTKLSKSFEHNILEKMKEWKAEMTVETGAASDWVSELPETYERSRSCSKQVLNLPKTNIKFEKHKRGVSSRPRPSGQNYGYSPRNAKGKEMNYREEST